MSSFNIQVKSASGNWATGSGVGTIIPDAGFNYSDKLSEVNEAQINVSGTGEVKRALIEMGSEIKIWRNDALDFHGLVNFIDYLEGGGISIHAKGYEWWLGLENGAYANSPWSSTASATIFSAVIGESNYFSAGTINAGTSVDYRAENSDSLWNVVRDLTDATSQDIGVDYPNSEIDILDHKGSATSVATFNAGLQIGNIRITHNYPLGNKVIVYGKSEGETRIKSEYPGHGKNDASQGTYGIITKIIRDPKITTVAQANILADAEVARLKDPVKVYAFEVMNPNQSIVSGDVITLNARSQGVTNEDVRIVGIERGVSGGVEYLTLQVTNAEYAKLMRTVEETMAKIDKDFRNQQTYDEYQEEYTNRVNTTTDIGGVIDVYPGYFDLNNYALLDTWAVYSRQGEDLYIWAGGDGVTGSEDLYLAAGATLGTGNIYLSGTLNAQNSYRAVGFDNPVNAQDLATKNYVDTAGAGDNLGNHTATTNLNMADYYIYDCDEIRGDGGYLDLDLGGDVKLYSYDDMLIESSDYLWIHWDASDYEISFSSWLIWPVDSCYYDLGDSTNEFDRIYCDDIYGDTHATTCDVAELQFVEEGIIPGDIVELSEWDSDEANYFQKELEECQRKSRTSMAKKCKLKYFGMQGKWKKANANSTKCPSIISTQPAFKMGETELRVDLYEKGKMNFVALSGSVPNVYIEGEFHAGDILISAGEGKAKVDNNAPWNQSIGYSKRTGKDERCEVWIR